MSHKLLNPRLDLMKCLIDGEREVLKICTEVPDAEGYVSWYDIKFVGLEDGQVYQTGIALSVDPSVTLEELYLMLFELVSRDDICLEVTKDSITYSVTNMQLICSMCYN